MSNQNNATNRGNVLPWPDRIGFWWFRHRYGMELAESIPNNDDDDPFENYAIRTHDGNGELCELNLQHDFFETSTEFAWLGKSFDSFLENQL